MAQSPPPQDTKAARNEKLAQRLLLAAGVMMAFVWLNVPMYRLVCKALGIYPDQALAAKSVTGRQVQVRFVGQVGPQLPIDFVPMERSATVTLGEQRKVMWRFTNLTDQPLEIQAVHSVSPSIADPMLHKLECFCFKKDTLKPKESKEVPVVFKLDPTLPADLQGITLGYTVYNLKPAKPQKLPSEQGHDHQHDHASHGA